MIGRVDFDGGALFLDHSGLYELETKHGIEPEGLFGAVRTTEGLRTVVGVALARAKCRGFVEQNPSVEDALNGMHHQAAQALALECISLALTGKPWGTLQAEGASAEGEADAPESGSGEA